MVHSQRHPSALHEGNEDDDDDDDDDDDVGNDSGSSGGQCVGAGRSNGNHSYIITNGTG